MFLQAFDPHRKAGAVPVQALHYPPVSIAEHKYRVTEQILLQQDLRIPLLSKQLVHSLVLSRHLQQTYID